MSTAEVEMPPVPQTFRLSIPNGSNAPKLARTLVARLLELTGHAFAEDSVRLLVSEVVTNVYKHTATPTVRIDISVRPNHVTVAVWDDNPQAPPKVHYAPTGQESGRGLRLLTEYATRWGVSWPDDSNAHGKNVWFSLIGPGG